MDTNRLVLVGVGGFVLGVLLSLLVGGDGDTLEAELARHEEVQTSLGQITEATTALEARVGELNERVGSVEESIGQRVAGVEKNLGGIGERVAGFESALADVEASSAEHIEGVRARLEGLGAELSGAFSDVGSRVEGLSGAVSDVGARVGGLLERARGEGGGSGGGGGATGAAASAGAEVEAGAGSELGIGETAHFSNGALRVFLSSVDPQAGTARVAINGPVATTVALGEPQAIGECTVTLTGFVERGATVSGTCGAAEAAAEMQAGAGTELGLGETAHFGDGALRVFLSSVDPQAGTARVAINGPTAETVALGEAVTVGDCSATLTGFVERGATVSGQCGGGDAAQAEEQPAQGAEQAAAAGGPESEAAASGSGSEGGAAASGGGSGTELGIGETAQFGDGALRLFLAFVDPEAGTARVSASGTGIVRLTMNEPAEVGACTVVLTGASEGSATLEARC